MTVTSPQPQMSNAQLSNLLNSMHREIMQSASEQHFVLTNMDGKLIITKGQSCHCHTPHAKDLIGVFEIWDGFLDDPDETHFKEYVEKLSMTEEEFKKEYKSLLTKTLADNPELFI